MLFSHYIGKKNYWTCSRRFLSQEKNITSIRSALKEKGRKKKKSSMFMHENSVENIDPLEIDDE